MYYVYLLHPSAVCMLATSRYETRSYDPPTCSRVALNVQAFLLPTATMIILLCTGWRTKNRPAIS